MNISLNIVSRVKNAEKIADYIREHLLTPENAFANGEINFSFIEADLVMLIKESDVADALPTPDFKITNYEQIDAAFDLIDRTHI